MIQCNTGLRFPNLHYKQKRTKSSNKKRPDETIFVIDIPNDARGDQNTTIREQNLNT